MPWQLLGSLIPVVVLLSLLIYHEYRSRHRSKEWHDESERHVAVGAECANEMHKVKYGRPSTELEREFPALKAIK